MITVACVFWGNKFSDDYVYHLEAMVARNTTVEHEFVVLSDRKVPGVKTKILKPGYEIWWNKLQLFDPAHGFRNRVVYLDLDTVITGNIDWLLSYDGPYMGIEDVGAVNKHQPHLIGQMQSAIISFDPQKHDYIWNEFNLRFENILQRYRGDGEYLHDAAPKQRVLLQRQFPGQMKSYKYEVYPDKLDGVSIVCFHGRPSIEQAKKETIVTPGGRYEPQEWISEYWYD